MHNEPITVFVPPYEDTVKAFIAADQQRLTDHSVFQYLMDVQPRDLLRSARAVIADLKREGKKMSPAMTAMMYKVDKNNKIILCPDMAAMAKYYKYQLYLHIEDRKGEKQHIGPIHHKGEVFGVSGSIRPITALQRIAKASNRAMTSKKTKP